MVGEQLPRYLSMKDRHPGGRIQPEVEGGQFGEGAPKGK